MNHDILISHYLRNIYAFPVRERKELGEDNNGDGSLPFVFSR